MTRALPWLTNTNSLLVIAAVLKMVIGSDNPALTVTGMEIVSIDEEARVTLLAITGRLRAEVATMASGCGGTS